MVMMMLHENGRPTMMHMSEFTHDSKTGEQGTANLSTDSCMFSRNVLHINLMENMAEELHAMIVIDGHELVILLLVDFMGDGLAIDDGGHAIEGISLGIFLLFALFITDRLNLDVIHNNLTTMLAFTEPTGCTESEGSRG